MYRRYSDSRPVICESASPSLRALLSSKDWERKLGKLARSVVSSQLSSYQKSLRDNAAHFEEVEGRFDGVKEGGGGGWKGVRWGEDPVGDVERIEQLKDEEMKKRLWDWEIIPYVTLCAARAKGITNAQARDIDEWYLSSFFSYWLMTDGRCRVLRNERYLRLPGHESWSSGLIKISDFPTIFPTSSSSTSNGSITLTRPEKMTGYTFLDLKRAPSISLHASIEGFKNRFDEVTGGVLRGLDWTNVFVAGGIVLGTLLSPPPSLDGANKDGANTEGSKESPTLVNSDIDLYIHSLPPPLANAKISQIFETFKSNLPPSSPTLVVRNSKTITFFSSYPTQRIQIVLKLVRNPKEVLLNFDLDVCAVGFDGGEVYMLPRTARALETGYSVFTMDLIQGHYLGERRASQEDRVFKYANKVPPSPPSFSHTNPIKYQGYGLRILPSYISSLQPYAAPHPTHPLSIPSDQRIAEDLELGAIMKKSKEWTGRCIDRYIKWGHTDVPTLGSSFSGDSFLLVYFVPFSLPLASFLPFPISLLPVFLPLPSLSRQSTMTNANVV
ncbi:hypothetical protein SISSUDRAFT_1061942 [Sistotremastrum suecicum HHB10207 ss-3]|uniref:Uncharacterized protein n=1 Tax=Sistotremastrum suecicum HHB10207 ss-3 TaxID=1314776 RepID=A0A166DFP3_9AGAM|nr:hypothetical protein SISSUDRAFT_1061942 [Sistotremastrum suecicum HHB10207 ss-3]